MKTVAAIFVLVASATPILASANVMTFDNLPPGQTYDLGSYTEDAITAYGTDFWNFPDGTLHLDVGGVPTNNESYSFRLGTALFDLSSFDVVALGVPENAIGVVRGYDAVNALKFSSEFSIATSRTLSFADWRDLSKVLIFATGDIDDHYSIDNLTLLATVPEPATWGMMLVGFGAVGIATRSRRPARTLKGN